MFCFRDHILLHSILGRWLRFSWCDLTLAASLELVTHYLWVASPSSCHWKCQGTWTRKRAVALLPGLRISNLYAADAWKKVRETWERQAWVHCYCRAAERRACKTHTCSCDKGQCFPWHGERSWAVLLLLCLTQSWARSPEPGSTSASRQRHSRTGL